MYFERAFTMEYTTLANDLKMPLLGIGTFMISSADAEVSVYKALKKSTRRMPDEETEEKYASMQLAFEA